MKKALVNSNFQPNTINIFPNIRGSNKTSEIGKVGCIKI